MFGPVAIAVLLATASVAEPAEPDIALTAAEQKQLQQSLDRGLGLYLYDQSAWHVTDAALAALPDTAKKQIRGYVTTPASNGLRTTFFGEREGAYYALYSAVWTGSGIANAKLYPPAQRTPVGEEELRLIVARNIALDSQTPLEMCNSARPNVIVVPASVDSTIHVYVLTPQTKPDSYPFGGHHRIDVRDGKVIGQRRFANSCLEMGRNVAPGPGGPVALMATHLLDPVPTEIHVFNVFAIGLPLYVSVPDGRVYAVEVSGGQPRARVVGNVSSSEK